MLLVLLLAILVVATPSAVRGELPTVVSNPDDSRTVTWSMNDAVGLKSPQNVSLGGGRAVLSWTPETLNWTSGTQIAANGVGSPNVVANASGLGLRANWTNYVRNGQFNDNSSWQFTNGTSQNVTAGWNGTADLAEFRHWSPGTEILWDSMDSLDTNWTASASGAVVPNYTGQIEGAGMMGLVVVSGPQASVWALRQSLVPLNWSAYDRLIAWVNVTASLTVTFNVTAHYGSASPVLTTLAQPLVPGWQEVVVDLDQLGNATVRANLTWVTLRFNGQLPTMTWFNVDDVRLGKAKLLLESASVSQTLSKANETTPLPGSARLSFDWCLAQAEGVEAATANVTLGQPAAPSFVASLGPSPVGAWRSFSQDVSSASWAAGLYNLTFGLTVSTNNTTASEVEFLVDNVTLVFPEITNGTFTSSVQDLGVASDIVSLAWNGSVPDASTSIVVGLRTGNDTDPASGNWSSRQTSSAPGPVPVTLPGGRYLQIEAYLNSTNASLSPFLRSLSVVSRHRAAWGNLTSEPYHADEDFLRWRSFRVWSSGGPNTSLTFRLGDNTSWTPVTSNATITTFADEPQILWQVTMATSNGLQTPAIFNVTLVYEYTGPVTRVRIVAGEFVNATVGAWTHLQAAAYDAGGHMVPTPAESFTWSGGDPAGHLYNNGSYLPGQAGNWTVNVTATVNGVEYTDSVLVVVKASAPSGPTTGPSEVPYALYAVAILGAAGAGFLVYEFAIRRMFAIDDVFVIGRDGRLLMHNTRRMRADRDEDVLSGMLTAMISFLRDWDPEENGKARRFDYGDKTALLEHGEHVFVAAVYAGRIPRWAHRDLEHFVRDLESRFGKTFERWTGDPADLHGLREFVDRFSSRTRYRANGRTSGG